MNKLLQLLLLCCVIFSCSQDTDVEQTANQPETRIVSGQFDNSHLGVYKGLFTTNDGLTRGSVEVTLTPNNEGIAKITLSSGEQIELKSSRVKLTADNIVNNLRFSSEGLNTINATLQFSVNADGSQSEISNVSFDNQASDILIAKNLSRAPLTPITGTYVRTAGTGGFPTSAKTWNIMSIGEGSGQTFATQVFYAGRIYDSMASNNVQTNCVDGTQLTTCDVDGSINILGYDVTWTGIHQYSLGSATCSAVSGTWSAPTYGNSSGAFTSDVDALDCVVVTPPAEDFVIGSQIWMNRNLDVETYRNGDPIPQVQDPTEWSNLTTGAWCYYNNDPTNGQSYGKLYNYYAVIDSRGLAPEGYIVPVAASFGQTGAFLGGNTVAGGKMKSVVGWAAPNTGATNESGFIGLPGGYRNVDGSFTNLSVEARFYLRNVAGYGGLESSTSILRLQSTNMPNAGYSVRCIRN